MSALPAKPEFIIAGVPLGSRAELRPLGGLTELVLDRPGKFKVAGMPGRTLVIDSLPYDEMPLDCGRSFAETSRSGRW